MINPYSPQSNYMPSKSQHQAEFFRKCVEDEKFRNKHDVPLATALLWVKDDSSTNLAHLPKKVKPKRKNT